MSALWPDTAKRGEMLLEVHGLGTLVPEETMLIPATTDGRVAQILVKPGTPVKADTVVMILVNPDLIKAEQDADFALKVAQADYDNLKVTLQKTLLDMKSTAAQVSADTIRPSWRPTATPPLPKRTCWPEWTPRSPP